MTLEHKLACESSGTNTNPMMMALYRELERLHPGTANSIYLNHIYLEPKGVMCLDGDTLKIRVGHPQSREWFYVSLHSNTVLDDIIREIDKAREYDRSLADYP